VELYENRQWRTAWQTIYLQSSLPGATIPHPSNYGIMVQPGLLMDIKNA